MLHVVTASNYYRSQATTSIFLSKKNKDFYIIDTNPILLLTNQLAFWYIIIIFMHKIYLKLNT